jgi:hypothetical protein
MVSATGRVYHPAPERVGGFGLIADKLSIQWTQVRAKRLLLQADSDGSLTKMVASG